jgi:hypothetical protein
VIGFELLSGHQCPLHTGRFQCFEKGACHRFIDLYATDVEAVGAAAIDDVLARAMVTGGHASAAVMGTQPPTTVSTGGHSLEERYAFSHGAAALVGLRTGVGAEARLIGLIGRPIDKARVVLGDKYGPLGTRQVTGPFFNHPLCIDIALASVFP